MAIEFTYRPTYSVDMAKQPKLREASFGDGYVQRTKLGVNNNPERWNLTFDELHTTTAHEIVDFFETHEGHLPFVWENFRGQKKNFTCKAWTIRHVDDEIATVAAQFEEYFG